MTIFQAIGLPLLGLFAIATAVATVRHAINRYAGLAWLLLWIGAAVAVARPSITITVAHALGIGRGTDLVLYCAIIGMLVAFFLVYIRFKRLERDITTVVREIAIRDAQREITPESSAERPQQRS
jgi:hypothetical protein